MNYFLFIIFFSLFTFFIYKNPVRGLFLILLFLPTYQLRINVIGLPVTILEGMIIITALCWLLPIFKNSKFSWLNLKTALLNQNSGNPISRRLALPITLILITSWLSSFLSYNSNAGLGIWKAYFFEAIIFFIMCVYLLDEKKYQTAINFFAGLAIVNGIVGFYQYLTGDLIPNPFWAQASSRRIVGLFAYPNANSLLFAPLVPLFIYRLYQSIITKEKWLITLFSLAGVFSLLTIYWSKSMGAVVALVFVLFLALLTYKKTRLLTLIFILSFSIYFCYSPLKYKVEKIFISTYEISLPMNPTSWQIRAQQWRETINLIKVRPIFGAGLTNYQTAVKPFHINRHIEIFLYPHNIFLNFWVEIGLLGLLGFVWLIGEFFRLCYKNYKKNPALTLALTYAMIVLLIHGLVDVPYFKNDLALMFWFIISGAVIIDNSKSNN